MTWNKSFINALKETTIHDIEKDHIAIDSGISNPRVLRNYYYSLSNKYILLADLNLFEMDLTNSSMNYGEAIQYQKQYRELDLTYGELPHIYDFCKTMLDCSLLSLSKDKMNQAAKFTQSIEWKSMHGNHKFLYVNMLANVLLSDFNKASQLYKEYQISTPTDIAYLRIQGEGLNAILTSNTTILTSSANSLCVEYQKEIEDDDIPISKDSIILIILAILFKIPLYTLNPEIANYYIKLIDLINS